MAGVAVLRGLDQALCSSQRSKKTQNSANCVMNSGNIIRASK